MGVRILNPRQVVALVVPPVLLVVVPAVLALLEVLVQGVHSPETLVHVVVGARHLRLQPRKRALDQHADGGRILGGRHVDGLLLLRLHLGQHVDDTYVLQVLVLLWEVEEVLPLHTHAPTSGACGKACEVGGVHPQRVDGDDATEVARGPLAHHFLELVEPVRLPIGDEPQGLDDDRHLLELPATLQVEGVARAPLEQVLDVYAAPCGHRQERDVTDTEAAGARDGALLPVLAAVDGPVVPRVAHAGRLIHWDEGVQHHSCWHRDDGLVHEPAAQTRAREVLSPRDEVNLLRAILAARTDVLHCESAVPENRSGAPVQVVVGDIVVHAVSNLSVEGLFAGVVDDPWIEVGAREVIET
mmetsp:Transcript_47448/g.122609  ORF Transcript_47448/g.122609 Transcript_47448/m.122609 type:complete len:357 (+) Transcript_47448:298-1368(+)